MDEGMGKGIVRKAIDTLDQDKDDKIFAAALLRLKEMKTDIIERALTGRVAIPDWADFVSNVPPGPQLLHLPSTVQRLTLSRLLVVVCVSHQLREIYEHCEALETGQNAQYIPQVLYHIPMVVWRAHSRLICGVCANSWRA